jgi:hypothetical protein
VDVDGDGDGECSIGGCEEPGDEVDGESSSGCKDVVDVVTFEDEGVELAKALVGG